MKTEENIIVCFSDNSYDNCNLTKNRTIPLWVVKMKFSYRQVCSYFHVVLEIVSEELLSENYFIYKKKNISQNKMGWIIY